MLGKKYPPVEEIRVEEDWEILQGFYEEKPMFIRANKGLKKIARHPLFSHQVGIAVPLSKPNEHGLPSNEEAEDLGDIEDLLFEELTIHNQSLLVGVITTGGMREFVFYTSDPEAVVEKFKALQKRITTHELQLMIQVDKKWLTYKNLLG